MSCMFGITLSYGKYMIEWTNKKKSLRKIKRTKKLLREKGCSHMNIIERADLEKESQEIC